jgi:two-component system chemotaxis response regulator CheB
MTLQSRPEAPIRVLIVDDSASVRAALKTLLAADGGIEVIGAADPFAAAEQMRDRLPDVMLLDLELPRMDGLTFLAKVMAQRPVPVVICSSHTEAGSRAALRALEIGAVEVIGKPRMATPSERQEAQAVICDAVRAAAQTGRRGRKAPAPKPLVVEPKLNADAVLPPARPGAPRPPRTAPLVAVGASTGGSEALAQVLRDLPADSPPVVIVQHMPEKFTAAFAQRLDGLCRVRVAEAASGDRLAPGLVLIAPGDRHLILRRAGAEYRVEIATGPHVSRHRPSVDVLFRSVAQAAGPNALGLLLTGMGDDGAHGLLEMRQAGARTAAQDEATSVVFGMPAEALRLGAAERALPLGRVAEEIAAWGRRGTAP